MPPKQVAYCCSCNANHPRPVGRNCKCPQVPRATPNSPVQSTAPHNLVAATAVVSHVGAPLPQDLSASATVAHASANNISSHVADKLPEKLESVAVKIDSIDRRVASNEKALADRATGSSQTRQHAVTSSDSVGRAEASSFTSACDVTADKAIVPSVDFLKENPQIQAQVDRRVLEIQQMNNQAPPGNIRSQRVG